MMATFKRGKWYWMDDVVNGLRYRLPLKTKNWQEALRKEKETLVAIAEGKAGSQGAVARQGFNTAADTYVQERQLHSAEKTYVTDRERSLPLRRFFRDISLRRITADSIVKYQRERRAKVSGRTVNLEVGLLRRILKRHKQWMRLAEDVKMLPEHPKPARVLSPEEKARFLETAACKPGWQIARCAAVLTLNTTMRGCELKSLKWRDVDLFERVLTIHRKGTKTDAGVRVIPLNRDAVLALAELKDRGENLAAAGLEHFVLPACEHGHIQPDKPMKGWRTAWRSLTRAAGLRGLRPHDLRHHVITELSEKGLGEETIMSLAGHVSREMLSHYSHIRLQAKRRAVEALETPLLDQDQAVEQVGAKRPN